MVLPHWQSRAKRPPMVVPRMRAILLCALFIFMVLAPVTKAEEQQVKIGARIANLTFKDIHYLPRSLDDFQRKKAFAVVFTATGCPLAQRYMPELRQLEKEYRSKGVQFMAIDADPADSILA